MTNHCKILLKVIVHDFGAQYYCKFLWILRSDIYVYIQEYFSIFFSRKTTSENRRQNIFPLKRPTCVLVNFLNPQMYLEPPISLLINLYSSVSLVSQ